MDGRALADGWPHTLIAVSLLLTIVLIAENVFPSLNRKHKDTKTRNKRNGSDNKFAFNSLSRTIMSEAR